MPIIWVTNISPNLLFNLLVLLMHYFYYFYFAFVSQICKKFLQIKHHSFMLLDFVLHVHSHEVIKYFSCFLLVIMISFKSFLFQNLFLCQLWGRDHFHFFFFQMDIQLRQHYLFNTQIFHIYWNLFLNFLFSVNELCFYSCCFDFWGLRRGFYIW